MIPKNCYEHRDRTTAPKACTVCQRIIVEADIVTRTVDAMLAAHYALAVNDQGGDDDIRPEKPTRDREVILRELMETDDDFLAVFEEPEDKLPFGWVRFVYGNDGWDVISDYTTNLEEVLQPVHDYIDREVTP